jgi:single-stranded DNA-binding protein
MSVFALVAGALFRDPEQRTAKSGKVFVIATVTCRDGQAAEFWRVTAFNEAAQAELMRLNKGDALSAQGALEVGTYERDGETKISRSIIADQVLALRQPRKPKSSDDKRPARSRPPTHGAPAFADDVPF